jgi:hypothetical protein
LSPALSLKAISSQFRTAEASDSFFKMPERFASICATPFAVRIMKDDFVLGYINEDNTMTYEPLLFVQKTQIQRYITYAWFVERSNNLIPAWRMLDICEMRVVKSKFDLFAFSIKVKAVLFIIGKFFCGHRSFEPRNAIFRPCGIVDIIIIGHVDALIHQPLPDRKAPHYITLLPIGNFGQLLECNISIGQQILRDHCVTGQCACITGIRLVRHLFHCLIITRVALIERLLLTKFNIISWLAIITEVKHLLASSPDAAARVN